MKKTKKDFVGFNISSVKIVFHKHMIHTATEAILSRYTKNHCIMTIPKRSSLHSIMKIAICFGTRPEIIKLCLLSKKIAKHFDVINIFTGQHHSLYEDVKHLIPKINHKLKVDEYNNINALYANLINELYQCFEQCKPDVVIVQGDTASTYCAAFCAFMTGIQIGHVEAGLRTYNMTSPFPEEFNRQTVSKMTNLNWCPSQKAANNLIDEKVKGKIFVTGNTIVDFIQTVITNISRNNEIIVTLHRRENENSFLSILTQINSIARKYPNIHFIFPVHPNPTIKNKLNVLKEKNIFICKPMSYESFVDRMSKCCGIITDSGGIQEEAVCLKKKILICRDTTEREEVLECGIGKLIATNVENNFEWLITPLQSCNINNPYGNGKACEKIIDTLIEMNGRMSR